MQFGLFRIAWIIVASIFLYEVAVESNLPQDHRTTEVAMHGAAVVLDIKTGQVRVLASYPDYDLNEAADKFAELAANDLDRPFTNRRRPGAFGVLPRGRLR